MAQISLTVLRCPDYGTAEQRQVRGVELTIGRGSECDWPLADPLRSLSRRHCRLEQVGAAWQVVDLSANGTFINFASEPIGRDQVQPLRDGDRLRLGDYELEVHLGAAAAAGTPFNSPAPHAAAAAPFLGPGPDDPFGAAPGGPGLFGHAPEAASPFGAPSGQGSGPSPVAGFAAVRLPGLDDPVEPDTAGDGLDLDISGGLGAFTSPPVSPGPAAQDDHAPVTGDAFAPPGVSSAPPPAIGAQDQGLVPDDWFRSIALASPAAPVPVPDFDFSPVASEPPSPPVLNQPPEPVATPWAEPPPQAEPPPPVSPWTPEPLPVSPFGGPGAVPLPFDEAPLASERPQAAEPDFRDSTAPGAYAPDWQEPVDVPLSGPAPVARPMAAPAPAPAPAPAKVPSAPPPRATVPPVPAGSADAQATLAALSTLLAGAGLPPETLYRAADDPDAALRHAGAVLQVAVAGLRALLVARGLVKREFRIEQTMLRPKENNPLKFAASDEHAMAALLDPRTGGLQAVQEAVSDLSTHEVAVLAATQAAARALLERLSPALLEAEDPGGSGLFGASTEKRLWGAYKRHHDKLMAQLEDDFDSAFGTAFARAYEQAVGRRKG